jgi:hypothetical protein
MLELLSKPVMAGVGNGVCARLLLHAWNPDRRSSGRL